jgi:hypothetical protein
MHVIKRGREMHFFSWQVLGIPGNGVEWGGVGCDQSIAVIYKSLKHDPVLILMLM